MEMALVFGSKQKSQQEHFSLLDDEMRLESSNLDSDAKNLVLCSIQAEPEKRQFLAHYEGASQFLGEIGVFMVTLEPGLRESSRKTLENSLKPTRPSPHTLWRSNLKIQNNCLEVREHVFTRI